MMARKHVTVIRHGHTIYGRKLEYEQELLYPLSEYGHNQARQRAMRLGSPDFNRIGSSPALHAVEMAVRMLQGRVKEDSVIRIPEFCFKNPESDYRAKVLQDMFARSRSPLLETYLAFYVEGIVWSLADEMAPAITRFIDENSMDEKILLVGHHVYVLQRFCRLFVTANLKNVSRKRRYLKEAALSSF
jgi:broad specificity phosphatase PhoE